MRVWPSGPKGTPPSIWVSVILFVLLSLGILAAFAGKASGRFLAFGAFGALVLWSMSREEAGWRVSAKRRLRHWRQSFRLPPPPSSEAAANPLVRRSHRERMDEKPPDAITLGSDLFLWIVVALVVIGGAWLALRSVMGR